MFFYLHFTRPPPEESHTSQPFLIAPSIANDLRTEYLTDKVDIYHAWVKCRPSSTSNAGNDGTMSVEEVKRQRSLGTMTQPQKLTTWDGNAYKEIQVFPPREARAGESWQLLLCCKSDAGFVTSVDLSKGVSASMTSANATNFGSDILPILSSPILFTARPPVGSQKARKQVRNERILKLPSSAAGERIGPLKMTEHLSFDLDKVRNYGFFKG